MIRRSAAHATASAALALAAILSACTSAQTPGPTTVPTVRPSPTPVPGSTPGPAALLNVTALNISLDPRTLLVKAGAPFVIHLRNMDPDGTPHVIDIRRADGTTAVQEQEPIDGGTEIDYVYGPLPAGDYVFICRVHPIPPMTGKLVVR